jgi:hypothetical protein
MLACQAEAQKGRPVMLASIMGNSNDGSPPSPGEAEE